MFAFLNLFRLSLSFDKNHKNISMHLHSKTFTNLKSKIVFVFLTSFLIYSCNQSENYDDSNSVSKADLKEYSIVLDTIILEPPAFSGEGYLRIIGSEIVFLDKGFNVASIFNSKGDYLERKLGKGEGPNEIYGFLHHGFHNGIHFFLGSSYDISFYNDKWIRERSGFLRF